MRRGRVSGSLSAILLTALMALVGCSAGSSTDAGGAPQGVVPEGGGASLPAQGSDGSGDDRLVIRTKVLRLEVGSTPEAVSDVRELTRAHNGTVESMEVATATDEWIYRTDETGSGDGTPLRGWITVRVPTASYDAFVADAAAVGKVVYQREATDDVTQEHVDLSARLDNLRAQEARLREFFDAAKDVKEMLAVETELGRVRGEIESLDAQVVLLERQAAMATVTVELSEPSPVVSPGGPSWGFRDALTNGIRGAASLLTGLLTVLVATSPIWLLGAALFFPIRALIRRRRAAAPSKRAPFIVHPTPPRQGDD